ncbi:response regulator [Bradyrhizobium sp. WYCCWR 13022]|uniref:response regulator transcription factor n=1 Tax=unclassified Bradyrhizobium TaxID=2631580 RepID=UPI00263ADE6F|nr:response regulator [Bradyrhizobium sp. WYCCWR 13022]MDN4984159.1 response regulator [Bradyrhizobium sp. WYCCWR 13022]
MAISSAVDAGSLCPPLNPKVFVVDDDPSVRDSLEGLISARGWETETFATAQAFLSRPQTFVPSCLVLDVSLPGLSGLELQNHLVSQGIGIPIIFITGHGDVPMTVKAMKAGAMEFLTKPFCHGELFGAIELALARSHSAMGGDAELRELHERHRSLSRREQEVMALVVKGSMNKQVGYELGISEITVKAHRGKMMRKMKARSLAELVIMGSKLQQRSPLN